MNDLDIIEAVEVYNRKYLPDPLKEEVEIKKERSVKVPKFFTEENTEIVVTVVLPIIAGLFGLVLFCLSLY